MKLSFLLKRALAQQCCHCGGHSIFQSWNQIYPHCPACGFSLISKEPDTWFFMYMSTAGMTGLFMIFFFLVSRDSLAVRILVPSAAAFFFVITHPVRKSIAFALDYWIHPEME